MESIFGLGTLNCIYFLLVAVGVIYTLFILIAGGLHEIQLPDIDIDVGEIGGVNMPDVHVETPGSFDHGEVGLTSLSPITIASFVTGFGAFGIISTQMFNVSPKASILWAALGAFLVGGVVHIAFIYVFAPQTSSEVRLAELVGKAAEVTVPIPAEGTGKITLIARGARVTYGARSATGRPIGRGTIVTIEEMAGSMALVKPRNGTQMNAL
ncbi:MAG: hypothetical protein ACUVV0_14935 [Anaerolineae bacterium]